MLTNDQLDKLMKKEKLTLEDLILVEDHLLSIQKIWDDHRIDEDHVDMDEDVYDNLNNDIERILARLNKENKTMQKSRLKLIK
jgi:archaellum component FlaC